MKERPRCVQGALPYVRTATWEILPSTGLHWNLKIHRKWLCRCFRLVGCNVVNKLLMRENGYLNTAYEWYSRYEVGSSRLHSGEGIHHSSRSVNWYEVTSKFSTAHNVDGNPQPCVCVSKTARGHETSHQSGGATVGLARQSAWLRNEHEVHQHSLRRLMWRRHWHSSLQRTSTCLAFDLSHLTHSQKHTLQPVSQTSQLRARRRRLGRCWLDASRAQRTVILATRDRTSPARRPTGMMAVRTLTISERLSPRRDSII